MKAIFATMILALGADGAKAEARPPLFPGMGSHHRSASSVSEAQRYFDQGLTLTYAFNHDEAIRSFAEAARLDPKCALAWWGIAYANGPHINNMAVTPEQMSASIAALTKAQALAKDAPPADRALIAAVAMRCVAEPPKDRRPLDEAYAEAMRQAWKDFPNDADVGNLFAESIMNLRPWDLWKADGAPQPGTEEVLETLDAALRLNPDHPGANHLYIHAAEASTRPDRAVPASDRLRDLVPGAGHLVHMPSHIDVRVGQWSKAVKANQRAIEADRQYRKASPHQGFYRVYMTHNHHFLTFALMMEGRSADALAAAREMVAEIPADYIREHGELIDGFVATPIEVLLRFGKWDEVLDEPAPPANLPLSTAIWRFARSAAYGAKNNLQRADEERAEFKKACAAVPTTARKGNNPASTVLLVAAHVLDGELAYRRDQLDEAIASLRKAAELEDQLRYDEPPDWIQPVRHTLGVTLLRAGKAKAAEAVYREDLVRFPENGWALFGLAESLLAQGKSVDDVDARFKAAWANADVKIHASCLCAKH